MLRARTVAWLAGAAAALSAVSAAGVGVARALAHTEPPTIQGWLAPKLASAETFATDVSTPGNALYRRFLTPDAYAARFGPSAAEMSAVRSVAAFGGLHRGPRRHTA